MAEDLWQQVTQLLEESFARFVIVRKHVEDGSKFLTARFKQSQMLGLQKCG